MSAYSKWEWRAWNRGDYSARYRAGRKYITTTLQAVCSALAARGLRPSIHRPSDSDSRYVTVNGYTIRFSDHEPVTILGRRVGGFDSNRGQRHLPADHYFHPGSTERVGAVVAAVAQSAAAKHAVAPLCGGI